MNHVDLFSGIGGFALAARWTGFETVVFCEKDEFCQKVLKKHWSEIPIIPEIRDFDGTKWRGATLLTGGFPCQPFSVAGKRKGKEDDRFLWPEMLRVIKEAKPTWVIAENVTGIVKLALGQVLFDLESIGYDFPRDHRGTPIVPVIPACGLNAPHRRYRIWVIAYSTSQYNRKSNRKINSIGKNRQQGETMGIKFGGQNQDAPDSECLGWEKRPREKIKHEEQITKGQDFGNSCTEGDVTDSPGQGLPESQEGKFREPVFYAQRRSWQIPWYEIATEFCRVDARVSNRVDRLKALGNAIVPQIAAEIMRGIRMIEEARE